MAFEGKLAVPMPGAAKPVLAAHEGATSSAGGIMDQEVLLHIVLSGSVTVCCSLLYVKSPIRTSFAH